MINVLLVDDDALFLDVYAEIVSSKGYAVKVANGGIPALEAMKKCYFQIVIIDVLMPDMNGLKLLELVREKYPMTIPMMLTGEGSIPDAVRAMEMGAFTYMLKPIEPEELIHNIRRAEQTFRLSAENISLKNSNREEQSLIGSSEYIQELKREIGIIANSNASVLITGESGTGKEIIAHMLHEQSERSAGPFVAVNCAALTETLLESELFGHEKGAFTGAGERKLGRIELANGGTLFFDEIGDMPSALQKKLLRVLQEKNFERVGGTDLISTDFRLISATNKNLEDEVREGRFREDLYYRINVIPVKTKPIRTHREDIMELVNAFYSHYCQEMNRICCEIGEDARELLIRYSWKGNVREIKNFAERLAVFSDGGVATADMIRRFLPSEGAAGIPSELDYREAEKQFQKKYLQYQLEIHGWNISKTAQDVGLSRKTLYDKIAELNIVKQT